MLSEKSVGRFLRPAWEGRPRSAWNASLPDRNGQLSRGLLLLGEIGTVSRKASCRGWRSFRRLGDGLFVAGGASAEGGGGIAGVGGGVSEVGGASARVGGGVAKAGGGVAKPGGDIAEGRPAVAT